LPGASLTGHSAKKIRKKVKIYLPGATNVQHPAKKLYIKKKNLCRVPRRHDTRQRKYEKNKKKNSLPGPRCAAPGKENLKKKIKNICRAPLTWHPAKQGLTEPAPSRPLFFA
jgi:hypothetical protein